MSSSSVANFYEGKSVFITGATGFVGKVLIEKLLHSCDGVDKIYILMRAKDNRTLNQRVEQLTKSPIFNRLKASRPDDLRKIIPLSGDLTAPSLGLSTDDEKTVLDKVSVVFHSAATISFNEPLRVALNVNYEGTQKVLELCKLMRNLCVLVHVSTAYTNTDKKVVEEKVYPPPMLIDDVYKFLENHGDDEKLTKTLLKGRPNTYCFTKSLTEAYLAEQCEDVPTVILRPSAVTAAVSEPVEGWLDSWQGVTTIMAMTARGFYRAILCNGQGITDLIPVDYVVNMAIVAASHSKRGKLSVYNCCTSGVNPITWNTTANLFLTASKSDHFQKMPFPGILFTRSWIVLEIVTLLSQTLPAYLMDAARLITGKRARYVKLNRKIISLRDQVQYFTINHWVMKSTNAQELAESLSGKDSQLFPCHPANIHWPSYFDVYYTGVKTFLFGERVILCKYDLGLIPLSPFV